MSVRYDFARTVYLRYAKVAHGKMSLCDMQLDADACVKDGVDRDMVSLLAGLGGNGTNNNAARDVQLLVLKPLSDQLLPL